MRQEVLRRAGLSQGRPIIKSCYSATPAEARARLAHQHVQKLTVVGKAILFKAIVGLHNEEEENQERSSRKYQTIQEQ